MRADGAARDGRLCAEGARRIHAALGAGRELGRDSLGNRNLHAGRRRGDTAR